MPSQCYYIWCSFEQIYQAKQFIIKATVSFLSYVDNKEKKSQIYIFIFNQCWLYSLQPSVFVHFLLFNFCSFL
uniref:Uncharacterized protein n=1 Tax=Anguilla anguilla TaxID=7936 RepID=A0A0E9WME6_ANGAN